jgi:hypothetical protein
MAVRFGNYEREYGFPPGTRTMSFGWWSGSVPGWPLAHRCVVGRRLHDRDSACDAIRPATVPRRMSLFAILLAAMGLMELAVSALADAGETERHLFLFHVITDFTVMLAIAWSGVGLSAKASSRANL